MDVLVLNFSHEYLNVTSIARAVRLVYAGKAEILESRDRDLRSGRNRKGEVFAMRLPTVLRLLYYVKRPFQKVALTKKNILLRDNYTCAYCGYRGGADMTIDHVIPKSRGGAVASWENCVTSCVRCNNRKNNRLLSECAMTLQFKPREPKSIPWITVKRNTAPGEWTKYLSLYHVSIEERIE